MAAGAVGLPAWAGEKMAEQVATGKKPSVIWLHFQECTGCTESLLRTAHPDLGSLILDLISVDYHETLFAAAGHQIEAALAPDRRARGGQVHPGRRGGHPAQGRRHLLHRRRQEGHRHAEGAGRGRGRHHRHRLLRLLGRRPLGGAEPDRRGRRQGHPPRGLQGREDRHPARLPGQPLQPARHRAAVRHLQDAAEAGRQGAPALRLRPRHPRRLPAPGPLRQRPLRAGLRRSGAQRRLVPLQARLQGAPDPRQLLAPPLLRGAGRLAHRHRPPVRRLHRAGDRLQRAHLQEHGHREAHRPDGLPGHPPRARRGRHRRRPIAVGVGGAIVGALVGAGVVASRKLSDESKAEKKE